MFSSLTRRSFLEQTAALAAGGLLASLAKAADALPQTQPLTLGGDLAELMVAGIDKYLMRELAAAPERRKALWKPDLSSPAAYARSLEPKRERLRKIIGAVDARIAPELQITPLPTTAAASEQFSVAHARWTVFDGMDAEGYLIRHSEEPPKELAIVLPDANAVPEDFFVHAGNGGVTTAKRYANVDMIYSLARQKIHVLIPFLTNRDDALSGNPRLQRMTNQPHREFIYRMAYEMGRHVIGYEVQKVLAAADAFAQRHSGRPSFSLAGYGEGGLLALFCAALDTRFDRTLICGYGGPAESLWREPIYRNLWSVLTEFGLFELAALIAPRSWVLSPSSFPVVKGPPPARDGRNGAAPGELAAVPRGSFAEVVVRIKELNQRLGAEDAFAVDGDESCAFARVFKEDLPDSGLGYPPPKHPLSPEAGRRQFSQMVDFTQKVVRQAETRRQEFFWSKLDRSSLDKYQKSCEPLRAYLWEEVIGKLPAPTMPANPRSRQIHDEPKWKGYEVVMDLYPDIFAFGDLLVPKDLKPNERRPVVVCQHGLEGRPADVVNPKQKTPYYNSFGDQLAQRGYIVFAPQNPYIGKDKFRVLQRKANPIKLSLFSFIVRQHERILDWLATLPFVDDKRLAFYGLSYGGKTAMRVPAILEKYCLSICSGDFNEWIWKNTSFDYPGSYMFTGEYEMPEFDLGNTFNYAEMAALIAPRPFMVERGHDDGVGIDEWVAYEYAKVRRHYVKLGIGDRTEIEFFNGGHEINGKGTFAFLARHLQWPAK